MRLTVAGKLVLLLIVASVLYYGYRQVGGRLGAGIGGPVATSNTGGPPPSNPEPGNAPDNPARNDPEPNRSGPGDILFLSTAAKKQWVDAQIEKFGRETGGRWKVVRQDMGSREAMQAILNGKVRPVLWSPGETTWPARLAEVWQEKHGAAILDASDPSVYRIALRSPLVFLTTQEKARFLRPVLGTTHAWTNLRELSVGRKKVPWGRFRFSHADPVGSSSGWLTFALILNEFNPEGRDPVQVVADGGFVNRLSELERALVYDEAARGGTTKLAKAYLDDPSRYDVITAYESHALEALPTHPDLAVIYPNPTAFSDHAVVLLKGDWITPEQREGGQRFLEFLTRDEAQADALKYHFRPTSTAGQALLAQRLQSLAAAGFKASVTGIELPPYTALNQAAYKFNESIAKRR